MSYDDLVTRLRATLAGPARAEIAAALAHRFRVVLVDEFQDTDPGQWEIMRRAFAHSGVTLVLIADPKQAIYAFRGADVYAYLEAARSGASTPTTPSSPVSASATRESPTARYEQRPGTYAHGSRGRRSPSRCGCGWRCARTCC